MPARRSRSSTTLARQSVELAVAAPQVIAHRLGRMAAHGAAPNARDVAEMQRMGTEKLWAFAASWQAMMLESFRVQQSLVLSFSQSMLRPMPFGPGTALAHGGRVQAAAIGVLSKGLAPVHRRAVANAKRLARKRTR